MSDKKINKLFVYGTLMTKCRHLTFRGTKYIKEAQIVGTLLNVGSFPGYITTGDTVIKGELIEFEDGALADLDHYEGFRHDNLSNSLYVRTLTKTSDGDDCYVYVFNQVRNNPVIQSGDWTKR